MLFPQEAYEATSFRMSFGWRLVLLVNEPREIERILVDDGGNYRKSPQQQRRLQPALGDGLLTAEGELWRSTRQSVAPHFNPRAIAAVFGDMQVSAIEMTRRWQSRPAPDHPLDLVVEFKRLTYDIISRTAFSGALNRDRAAIHAEMAVYFDTVGRIDLPSILGLPPQWPSLAQLRAARAIRAVREVIERIVEDRCSKRSQPANDLLDKLLNAADPTTGVALSPQLVTDNLLTFLVAGHETTANALSWILYLLATHREAEEQVRREIDAVVQDGRLSPMDLDRLTFTRAVVDEAMRLYPPVPFIGRRPIGRDVVDDHPVDDRSQILISPWVVHRHRAFWSDPDAFRPERFLRPDRNVISRGAFLPFGLGPRICIGQRFALQEILIVLAAIIPMFRFELSEADRVFPLARITLSPAQGLFCRVAAR